MDKKFTFAFCLFLLGYTASIFAITPEKIGLSKQCQLIDHTIETSTFKSSFPLSNPSGCQLGIGIPDNICGTANNDIPILVTNWPNGSLGTDVILKEVQVIFAHNYLSDIQISLEAPNGVKLNLVTNVGGMDDNYGDPTDSTCSAYTSFSTEPNAVDLSNSTAPYIGTFFPEQSFDNFYDNSSPNGIWTLRICDVVSSDTGSLEYVSLVFDTPPTCPTPSNLNLQALSFNSATIDWVVSGTETNWEVLVEDVTVGQSTTPVTYFPGNFPQFTIPSLISGNSYEVYVRANCQGNGLSQWLGPISLTPLCPAPAIANLPWIEDFEGFSTPEVPCNWFMQNSNGDGEKWKTSNTYSNSGSNALSIRFNQQIDMDDWAITPQFWLEAGETYELSFYFRAGLGSYAERLKVMMGTSQNANGMTTQLINYPKVQNITFTPDSISFQVPVTGGYYFGFHGYSEADKFELFIDDISLKVSPYCAFPKDQKVMNITTTSAELSWLTDGQASMVEYGPAGFMLGEGDALYTNTVPVLADNLTPNTYYDFYLQADCASSPTGNLLITGIMDGNSTYSSLNVVELYAVNNIANLSGYEIGIADNGGGTNGPEMSIPSIPISAGRFIYITSDSADFRQFFGFDADIVNSTALVFDGNDAIELYKKGVLVDVFGNPTINGVGTTWEYTNAWAYRGPRMPQNNAFNPNLDWVYGGVDCLEGVSENNQASKPFPLGTYLAPVSGWVGPYQFKTQCSSAGDDLSNPIIINNLPFSNTSTTADCFSNTIGHPSPDVVYQFTTGHCTSSVSISLCNSVFNTYLTLYQDGAIVDSNDDFCGFQSSLSTPVSPNTAYTVIVEGVGNSAGIFTLEIEEEISTPLVVASTVSNDNCSSNLGGIIDLMVSGGTPPYQFQWSHGPTSEDVSHLTSGNYTVSIVDAYACASVIEQFEVFVPGSLVANASITNIMCSGSDEGAVSLTITGGVPPYVVVWDTGSMAEDLIDISAGTYTATITDNAGCTITSGPHTVSEPETCGISNIAAEQITCHGDENGAITVSVTGGMSPYTYSWSNGANTTSITGLAPGSYTLSVVDANGCSIPPYTHTLSEPDTLLLSANVINETTIGLNDGQIQVGISGGTQPYTLLWDNGEVNDTITNLAAERYCLTVTDANACTATICRTVLNGAPNSLDSPSYLDHYLVYPNPSNGWAVIELEFSQAKDIQLQVLNVLGQIVYENRMDKVVREELPLDLVGLPAGTYFVNLIVEGQAFVKKIVLRT